MKRGEISDMTNSKVHRCECTICQKGSDQAVVAYHEQINLLLSCLTEPQRRWYAGFLAQAPHELSEHELSRITGLSRDTIRCGRRELAAGLVEQPGSRQRKAGAGRAKSEKKILRLSEPC